VTAAKSYALTCLFDAVSARFESDCTDAPNLFGWREPQKHKVTTRRIVWVPGNETGDAGELRAARNPGRNPRSLATLAELFHVRIEAYDPQFVEDERKQYEAVRGLYDAWVRAVYLAAHGTFQILSQAYDISHNERRHGATLIVICEVEAVVPDTAHTVAPVDTGADITSSLEDVDENVIVTIP